MQTPMQAAAPWHLLCNHHLKATAHDSQFRADQKRAGGRPLPKSKRQELGIFHCEEGSVELLLCNKPRLIKF